eukprot:TRINITY_DN13263_c0_g1_i1.p1 TRINITY_DN13263_c0_g1~~TRINITY_DN13263_c0_g1_i1.p1  ORF type:complete len:137 (-),score=26.41 TRINITY_DN13263_c0_g1_i1:114-524(-)
MRMVLDDTQSTLFTGGRDLATREDEGFVKVWDVSSPCEMRLLRSLSFPGQDTERQVMGLCYSKNWNIGGYGSSSSSSETSAGGVSWMYEGLSTLGSSSATETPRMESPGLVVATTNTLWYLSNVHNKNGDDEHGID